MGTLPSFLEEAPGRSPPPWGTHSGSPPLSSILNKQEPLSHCPVPAPPFLHFPALIYSPSFDLGDSPPTPSFSIARTAPLGIVPTPQAKEPSSRLPSASAPRPLLHPHASDLAALSRAHLPSRKSRLPASRMRPFAVLLLLPHPFWLFVLGLCPGAGAPQEEVLGLRPSAPSLVLLFSPRTGTTRGVLVTPNLLPLQARPFSRLTHLPAHLVFPGRLWAFQTQPRSNKALTSPPERLCPLSSALPAAFC